MSQCKQHQDDEKFYPDPPQPDDIGYDTITDCVIKLLKKGGGCSTTGCGDMTCDQCQTIAAAVDSVFWKPDHLGLTPWTTGKCYGPTSSPEYGSCVSPYDMTCQYSSCDGP